MTAYYNENDPYAAAWLRNLIAAGHIAPGVVDERSIRDVEAFELMEFTQCHFFAGIGVWSYALRQAGWADDREIWTGSCPCQPFSLAGNKKGFEDDRHLWPTWFNLIAQRKPASVIGEQVDKALDWVDLVSSDLQKEEYAFGAAIISAAAFEGAHVRKRTYFGALAYSFDQGSQGRISRGTDPERENINGHLGRGSTTSGLANSYGGITSAEREQSGRQHGQQPCDSGIDEKFGPANAPLLGRQAVDWLCCRDGKWRPVESGTFPLVDATTARVGRLRAYGNALDAETATEFCKAFKEICDGV